MKVLLNLIVFFTIIFVHVTLFGQADFSHGYLILNSNDTLYGYIDLRDSKYNSQICRFRENMDSEIHEYRPFNIKAYYFDIGKFYISKVIKLNSAIDTVFVEYLVDGVVNLYYYKDEKNIYYIFEKEGNEPVYITNNEVYTIAENGVKYVKENITNRGLLIYYLNEYPEIREKIYKMKLEQKYIIPMIDEYNRKICPDEECIIYSKNIKSVFSLGPTFGLNQNRVLFGASGYQVGNESVDYGMLYGISAESTYPTQNKRSYFSFSLFYLEHEQKAGNPSFLIHLKYKNIGYNISSYYCYNHYKIQPFLGVGFFGMNALKTSKIFDDNTFPNTHERRFSYGFFGFFGLKFKINDVCYIKTNLEFDLLTADSEYTCLYYTFSSNKNISLSVLFNL